jgi:hypothetical protein
MKITIYELLRMIKDGNAPKKIKYNGVIFENNGCNCYINEEDKSLSYCVEIPMFLNDEVEILEEEPRNIEVCGSWFTKSEYEKLAHSEEEKKIPEKLDHLIGYDIQQFDDLKEYVEIATSDLFGKVNKIIDTLNEVLDYLKSKGE